MSGLKCILIVLFCSLFCTDADGAVGKAVSPEWLICMDMRCASDDEKITSDTPHPLCNKMIIVENDYQSVKSKIHAHKLFNYSSSRRIYYKAFGWCEAVDVNLHPLDYYIYTLEKIVI